MSNRFHAVVHDPDDCLPFLTRLLRDRALPQRSLEPMGEISGRARPTCDTFLATPDAVFEKASRSRQSRRRSRSIASSTGPA